MRKLLYLYREIMPYNIPVLIELVKEGFEVTVVSRDRRRKSSYEIPDVDGVIFFDEDDYDNKMLQNMVFEFKPDMVFVNDWSMNKYNMCALFAR